MIVNLREFLEVESTKLPKLISNFKQNLSAIKEQIVSFVQAQVAEGKSFWCIGASTKGNTILSYLGLDSSVILGIADKNPLKLGRVTPGTRIPIYSKEALAEVNPDYAIVLPWHFKKSISENESDYIGNGGKLIFPLPRFQVLEG
jgi:ABC-type Fe3+-hydroxamate transport system substrate-binding protein